MVKPEPVGWFPVTIIHIFESLATICGRVSKLIGLPLQVKSDVAAQMPDAILNLPGAFGVATVRLPASGAQLNRLKKVLMKTLINSHQNITIIKDRGFWLYVLIAIV